MEVANDDDVHEAPQNSDNVHEVGQNDDDVHEMHEGGNMDKILIGWKKGLRG